MIITYIFAFLTGAFTVLLVQAFLLYKWWSTKEKDTPKLVVERGKVTNPKIVSDYLKSEGATEKETCMFLNLLVSFLWQEWRDSPKTKQFFMNKMNMEFSDLMNGKTAGRFIEQITILDLNLGKSLPVFKGATIMKVGPTKDATEVPKELDIALDLEYTGGCHMSIQVDFLFNKTAYFSVKLVCLRGRARLQFSRDPCTHWSLSFYEEPEMEFEAESHLEGKNIEQLTSLITNHLRRNVNKKHTLPSYKIRYLPFFPKLEPQSEKQDIFIHDSMITMGQLDVIVNGCSRLPVIDGAATLSCSLSVDVLPWKQLAENSRALWTTFEVEITRDNTTASFGMTLSKEYKGTDIDKVVFVETIVPSSPADVAGLHRGDVIVSVEGQRIDSLKQAAKLIKNKTKFTANFQRPPSKTQKSDFLDGLDGVAVNFKNVAVDSEESDAEEQFVNIMLPIIEEKDGNEDAKSVMRDLLTKSTELRQRSKSRSREDVNAFKDAHDGSVNLEGMRGRRAMTIATDGRPEAKIPEVNSKTLSPIARSATMKSSKSTSPTDERTKNSLVIKPSLYSDIPGTKRTKEIPFSQEPVWGDTLKFDVGLKDRYLNVCVWSKPQDKNDKDILIGHVTVPLMDVVVQCLALGSRRHEQTFVLVSPHIDKIISRLTYLRGIPGLNSSLVGGDISLAFIHYSSFGECDDLAVLEKMEELEKLKAEEEEWETDSLESEGMEHNFIFTQFYFPTRCNYCSKKIWRKVAFQCRNCALICHKKCLDSCRRFSSCLRSSGKKSRWFSRKSSENPNTSMTLKEQEQQEAKANKHSTHEAFESEHPIKEEERESEKIENEKKAKERNGDLTANQETLQITTEHPADDKAIKQKSTHDMDEASGPTIQEKGEAIAADMATASEQVKEMGRELFSNLPHDARKKKLQDMMARLQVEIDEENETLGELYKTKKRTKDKKHKALIMSMITKSEERGQALAMLMLQYCAGMQDCADAEDEECCEL